MKCLIKTGFILKCFCLCITLELLFSPNIKAMELNSDGRALIQEAMQAYTADMRDRPIVSDPVIINYITQIGKRLVPAGKHPPKDVTLAVTVIESQTPELYSYMDGHVIITSGMIFAMDNEAQLAGVLAHEIAHLVEGYYIDMYQEIKAAERRQRHKAVAGALFGSLLDVAVDYAVEMEEIKRTDQMFSGEATYKETMKRMAAIGAAQSAYYSIKDVIASIPAKDDQGKWIDPRYQFEAVADAQGMEYLALAGYDISEAARGWEKVHLLNSQLALEQEQALGSWASQLHATQSLMEMSMHRLRQSLGSSGLVQTISDSPPTRSQFVEKLTNLQEVRTAEKNHGHHKGEAPYREFLKKVLFSRAEKALQEEHYELANHDYRILYEKGVRNGPIVYGFAKSKLGDFAFGASQGEKQEAEALYKEAARLDPTYALPYRGMGELYDDWERYENAVQAYRHYLKLAPKAEDRNQIERKIKMLERKANR